MTPDHTPPAAAVDAHGHWVPAELLNEIVARKPGFVTADHTGDGYIVRFAGQQPLRPIAGIMLDNHGRDSWLDAQGLGHQIVAPWLDLQGQLLPAGTGKTWSRILNDAMAQSVGNARGRLSAHASLHFGDPSAAAQELRRAATELGMTSAMIPTNVAGGPLADQRFDEIWSAADQLGVPLFLHATTSSPPNSLLAGYPTLGGLFGRYVDTTLVAAELIVAGVFDRFPELRLIIAHGGGFLPYQAVRFDRDAPSGRPPALRLPSQIVRSLYYDTTMMSAEAVGFLCDFVGSERLVVGSDYGATPRDRSRVEVSAATRACGAGPAAVDAILYGNARRLFGVSA
jgi:aminocarboxymuconate-semialdehyde decarboxylase